MLASSSTPDLCSPREMICLITSSTEPGWQSQETQLWLKKKKKKLHPWLSPKSERNVNYSYFWSLLIINDTTRNSKPLLKFLNQDWQTFNRDNSWTNLHCLDSGHKQPFFSPCWMDRITAGISKRFCCVKNNSFDHKYDNVLSYLSTANQSSGGAISMQYSKGKPVLPQTPLLDLWCHSWTLFALKEIGFLD